MERGDNAPGVLCESPATLTHIDASSQRAHVCGQHLDSLCYAGAPPSSEFTLWWMLEGVALTPHGTLAGHWALTEGLFVRSGENDAITGAKTGEGGSV